MFFKDLPNVFGITDDIIIAEYNVDRRDHDRTMKQGKVDMALSKPKAKQK